MTSQEVKRLKMELELYADHLAMSGGKFSVTLVNAVRYINELEKKLAMAPKVAA